MNTRPLKERFEEKIERITESGCWLWTAGSLPFGYGHIHYNGKQRKAHRVSWFLKYGAWPKDLVLHRCDVPCCVNPDHLFEGTYKDNNRDRDIKGRSGQSKLNPELVLKIRGEKGTTAEIARKYGVAFNTIASIKKRKSWGWV